MTGLDKILRQIQAESDATANEMLQKAHGEAEQIAAAAREQATHECESIARRSAAEVSDTLARARSAALLAKKKAILAEKQRLIGETIANAKTALCSLPDDRYFDAIIKMAVKFALPQNGKILFSEKDKSRLPQNFENTLNAAIQAQGAHLALSEETRKIDGGFVLVYGGIEENCSFAALFDSAHETLQDKVHELLFS